MQIVTLTGRHHSGKILDSLISDGLPTNLDSFDSILHKFIFLKFVIERNQNAHFLKTKKTFT